ncbi:MAG: LysM domain-containing protein [Byssovorax sp.]
MTSKTAPLALALPALVLAASPVAFAQDPGGAAPAPQGGDDQGTPGQNVTVIQLPPQGAPTYPGNLPPAGFNPDSHLGAGSRSVTDTSHSTDGFDFGHGTGGPPSVRGSATGSYVVEGSFVPEQHAVRRGDTLWEISSRYYQSPYQWPRIWAYNPQIQNPHWIYPGDRVRLRDASSGPSKGSVGFLGFRSKVPPQTVFLREVGWVDDKKEDTWGELVGSPGDKMMLADGDDIYVQLDEGHEVQPGDELTIFRPIRSVESDSAKGSLVSIRGTARVDRYNTKTRMVRAKIIESLDVIERGAKIGPVGRKFDMVPPVASDVDLDATILAAVYPNQVFSQNQVVFIDRGEKDGVKVGQRFFAVRRGDRWANAVSSAGTLAVKRPRVEDDRAAQVDTMTYGVDDDLLPDETYAELRVVRLRDHTCAALVTAARHEIERNARLVTKKGL